MSGEDSGEMIIIDSADDNPTSATSVPEFVIMTMQEAKWTVETTHRKSRTITF